MVYISLYEMNSQHVTNFLIFYLWQSKKQARRW